MKKTKIICTLGPATDNPQILEKMILSGMTSDSEAIIFKAFLPCKLMIFDESSRVIALI